MPPVVSAVDSAEGPVSPARRLWSRQRLSLLSASAFACAAICFLALLSASDIDSGLYPPLAIAGSLSVLCSIGAYRSARDAGTVVDGRLLAFISFMIAYPLSSIAHLLFRDAPPRGFYDLLRSKEIPLLGDIYFALLLMTIALLGLWAGMGYRRSMNPQEIRPRVSINVDILIPYGLLFTVIGLVGTFVLALSQESVVESLTTINRGRVIGGGQAKFFFMSEWLSWGGIFLLVSLLSMRRFQSPAMFVVIVIVVSSALIFNVFWTGGRAFAAAMLLPMLFFMRKVEPSRLNLAVVSVFILVVGYFVIASLARVGRQGVADESALLVDVFDWHMGRFSMVGLSIDYVRNNGFLLGSTVLHGFVSALNAPLVLMQMSPVVDIPAGFTSVIGGYLTGDSSVNAIVPGTVAELYANFGVPGVGIGYLLIGYMIRWSVSIMERTASAGSLCLSSYLIVLLCLTCIPGTMTGWMYYLITAGLPALVLPMLENRERIGEAEPHLWQGIR